MESKDDLIRLFEVGKAFKYMAVIIEGVGKIPEIIINRNENFEEKMDYYLKTYDDKLVHKHAKDIKIIGVMFSNKFDELEKLFG